MNRSDRLQAMALLGTALGLASAAQGDPHIVSVGVPPGWMWSQVSAVNGGGTVAVFSQFRWTAPGTWEQIGPAGFCTGEFAGSSLSAISADGSVVAGTDSCPWECSRAFRWTPGGGIEDLGELPGGSTRSTARAISADGQVIVGFTRVCDHRSRTGGPTPTPTSTAMKSSTPPWATSARARGSKCGGAAH